jgi:Predicted membrane protein
MICQKCGAKNSDEAVYCQKCGTLLVDEEETRVAVRGGKFEDDAENQIFSVRPTLLFVKIGYGLAVLGAFLLVFLLYYISSLAGVDIPAWLYVLLGLSLLLIPAYFHFRRNIVRYTLTDSKVEIDEGFIFQNSRSVPLRSIQDVSVSSTVWQRMLGYGDLVIDNASEDDGKIVLKNISSPKKHADLLLKQMRLLDK